MSMPKKSDKPNAADVQLDEGEDTTQHHLGGEDQPLPQPVGEPAPDAGVKAGVDEAIKTPFEAFDEKAARMEPRVVADPPATESERPLDPEAALRETPAPALHAPPLYADESGHQAGITAERTVAPSVTIIPEPDRSGHPAIAGDGSGFTVAQTFAARVKRAKDLMRHAGLTDEALLMDAMYAAMERMEGHIAV